MKINENNIARVGGIIKETPVFNHEIYGEKFYRLYLEIERKSAYKDVLPVLVSERMGNLDLLTEGTCIKVTGSYRSYNKWDDGKSKLELNIFADEIQFIDDADPDVQLNEICLDGYICKTPVYRNTPLGREITDLLIAVNRSHDKSDYIPCICWGRNAVFASGLVIGDHIQVVGRIQSREFKKKISENAFEIRTAYEVSISTLGLAEENANEE